MTKFQLDLRIPMTNLHMQFESYTCIETKVRERKLKRTRAKIALYGPVKWVKIKLPISKTKLCSDLLLNFLLLISISRFVFETSRAFKK
jgi:hypothetical protein